MTAAEFREAVLKDESSNKKGEVTGTGKHSPPESKPKTETFSLTRGQLKVRAAAALILLAVGFGIGQSQAPDAERRIDNLERTIEELRSELDG